MLRLRAFAALLCLLVLLGQAQAIDSVDKAALDAFYNGLTNKGLLPESLPADWCTVEGITCEGEKVIVMDFNFMGLVGAIASELGSLTSLEQLYLSGNQLSGTVPTEIGGLSSLKQLYLQGYQLTGALPTELGSLSSLIGLYLDSNQLTGAMPTELGGLSSLQYLHLQDNQLTGAIPTELGSLSSLHILYLNDNQLTGALPTELGSLSSLFDLYLNNNRLTGAIPTELGSLSSLFDLHLNNNQLTGTIPTELDAPPSLFLLYLLGTNQFACPVPDFSTWAEGTDYDASYVCIPGCPSETYNRAAWATTAPGQTAIGSCLAGWTGTPTRICKADETWQDLVRNHCTRLSCPAVAESNAMWGTTLSSYTAHGQCNAGYQGRPTRVCQADGTWATISNPCTLIAGTCPPETYNRATWAPTAAGQTAIGSCIAGWTGTPNRICKADGTWQDLVRNHCTRI